MTKVGLQFHADAAELLELGQEWMDRHGLWGAVERFFPEYRAEVVPSGETLAGVAARMGGFSRICLGRGEVAAPSRGDIVDANPESFLVQFGGLTDEGLRESFAGAVTDDEDTLRLWRKLVRDARARMHKGAMVVNPVLGGRDVQPSHRHTKGAHELAAAGVTMLAVAGWVQYVFDDVSGSELVR